MAKLKRYDLYEGDDDLISPSLPGKQPLGRDKGLRARDEYDRQVEEEARKRRYFASNEKDDGLGAPSSLFDDFDRFESPAPIRAPRPKYKRKDQNRGAWAAEARWSSMASRITRSWSLLNQRFSRRSAAMIFPPVM